MSEPARDICTFMLGGLLFGLDVAEVQEVIHVQRMTRVPLAPPAVAGLLNVRGGLVTAIDLRPQLQLPPAPDPLQQMNLVMRAADATASLLVDSVGEVVRVETEAWEPTPPTMRGAARELVRAVAKLSGQLLFQLDAEAVLNAASARPN
jgi:purine-binding chemotaxis protein CheW